MSKKIVALLSKYGPMLSGELARIFEREFGVSNTTARQALSRAKNPVNKICNLSFEKNQKFFYLESQYMSQRYIDRFMDAIKKSSQVNWAYISAMRSQNGYVSKDVLPALVSSPVRNIKGHKLHERVIDDLLKCHIIEEYDESHWMLANWIPVQSRNIARSTGLEVVKKQVVNDFARWARNINLIGYDSAKIISAQAEFAQFNWALTAPSYVQPLFNLEKGQPGFMIADIFYGHVATVEDVKFFLDKLSIIRSFKKLPDIFPVFLVESVTPEALKELKDNKVVVALIKNIFDQKYTELLAEIVSVFTNSSAIISKNPQKIQRLFSEISKADGRYNDIIGDMFELLAGYYFQHVGCRYLEIRKSIQIPDSAESNEIDVLVERDGELIIVECKASRSALGTVFVEKWLSQTIKRIRTWAQDRYRDGRKMRFQLWSLGGFTSDAVAMLSQASMNVEKYDIEFYDKNQIIDMAREHRVQPVVDVLRQHFEPPLEKVIKKHSK